MTKNKPQGTACAYIRVSKVGTRSEDDLLSPELQLHEIEQHARRKNIKIVKVVQDIDKSGRSFGKRRVGEVISDIRAGRYDTVLLWKWSRWGRNMQQSQIYLAQVEDAGGAVDAATESFDTKKAYGKFTRNFFLVLAELQSDQIGEGWKEVHASRRRKGLPYTGGPRFGYRYVKGEDGRDAYVIDVEEAKLVREAYERYTSRQTSLRALAIEWNGRGIRNPYGRRWSTQTLRNVLCSGFAAGLIRERTDPPKEGKPNRQSMEAFDVWRPGAHAAIISAAEWEAFKGRLEGNAKLAPAARTAKYALTGLVVCSLCGRRMTVKYSGGGAYRMWKCPRAAISREHEPLGISDIKVMGGVLEWMERNAVGESSVTELAQALDLEQARVKQEADQIAAELRAIKAKLNRLQDGWMSGKLTDDYYDAEFAEATREKERLEDLTGASQRRDDRARRRPSIEQFRGVVDQFPQWSTMGQNAFLGEVLGGVLVLPDRSLRFVPAWVE